MDTSQLWPIRKEYNRFEKPISLNDYKDSCVSIQRCVLPKFWFVRVPKDTTQDRHRLSVVWLKPGSLQAVLWLTGSGSYSFCEFLWGSHFKLFDLKRTYSSSVPRELLCESLRTEFMLTVWINCTYVWSCCYSYLPSFLLKNMILAKWLCGQIKEG